MNKISFIAIPQQEGFKTLIFETKKETCIFFGYSPDSKSFNYRFNCDMLFYPIDKSGKYAESYLLDILVKVK